MIGFSSEFFMDVSIIIVSYNTKELVRNCLHSVFQQTKDIIYEVIVSDNGSTDGSIQMLKQEFPQVILIENNENLGFGAANNRGLSVAKGKYIFYLNSDTVLLNNGVRIFFDYWEKNDINNSLGCIGGMLLDKNGNFSHSYNKFPSAKSSFIYFLRTLASSLYIKKILKKKNKTQPEFYSEVDFVIGADMFLLNDENAFFDERFFMYFEETDLQFRLMKKNKARKIIQGPKIIHLEGGSSDVNRDVYNFNKLTSVFYWESCLKYIKKNCSVNGYFYLLKLFYYINLLFPWNKKGRKYFWSRKTKI